MHPLFLIGFFGFRHKTIKTMKAKKEKGDVLFHQTPVRGSLHLETPSMLRPRMLASTDSGLRSQKTRAADCFNKCCTLLGLGTGSVHQDDRFSLGRWTQPFSLRNSLGLSDMRLVHHIDVLTAQATLR